MRKMLLVGILALSVLMLGAIAPSTSNAWWGGGYGGCGYGGYYGYYPASYGWGYNPYYGSYYGYRGYRGYGGYGWGRRGEVRWGGWY